MHDTQGRVRMQPLSLTRNRTGMHDLPCAVRPAVNNRRGFPFPAKGPSTGYSSNQPRLKGVALAAPHSGARGRHRNRSQSRESVFTSAYANLSMPTATPTPIRSCHRHSPERLPPKAARPEAVDLVGINAHDAPWNFSIKTSSQQCRRAWWEHSDMP